MIRQAHYFTAVILTAGIQFLANYFLSQKLTLEQYGSFSLVSAAITIFVSLFMFGQATAISTVYFSDDKKICKNINSEFITSIRIILISFIGFSFFGLLIWNQWYSNTLSLFIVLIALFAALSSTFQIFFISAINCLDQYRIYLFSTIISSVILIFVLFINTSIFGYLLALIASGISSIAIINVGFKRSGSRDNIPSARVFGVKDLLYFGWAAIPGMVISSAIGFMDKYLLGHILSLYDVAIYSMATLLSVSIGRVLISALVKSNSILLLRCLQDGDGVGCNKIFHKMELLLCASCILALIIYYCAGKLVVVGILGDKFLPAVPILLALFLAVMLEGEMQFMAQILIQKRRLYVLVMNSALLLLLSIALNYMLMPIFFVRGAVLTFFICNLLSLFIVYFQIKKYVNWIRFPYFVVLLSGIFFVFTFLFPVM
jgi:O-antigen/teichoic acid export membrane protein